VKNVEINKGSFSRVNKNGVRWGVKLKDAVNHMENKNVANSCGTRRKVGIPEKGYRQEGNAEEPDNNSHRLSGWQGKDNWTAEPSVGRVADGIPKRVDRLKGLGNAIVPQIAMKIGEAIKASIDA